MLELSVGRFQIMSLLQAARANSLGLPLESAYSWGLNRATFIAAAKRGFKAGGGGREGREKPAGASKKSNVYYLGDDMAYKTEKNGGVLFTFGGKVQTKDEFDRRVASRFGERFPEAWKEAIAYVNKFDNETLLSADDFFREVYRPVRDSWADKWTTASETNDK